MSHTIAAVSTGNVISAIGIIRLTGDESAAIGGKVFTCLNKKPLQEAPNRKLILGDLHDKQGRIIGGDAKFLITGPSLVNGNAFRDFVVDMHCVSSRMVTRPGTSGDPPRMQ